jgi:M6 family metalloprotease-like protein
MIRRVLLRAALCGASLLVSATPSSAVTPPRDGGRLPEAFLRAPDKHGAAFMPRRAWAEKARGLREARRDFVLHNGPQALTPATARTLAVTGTMRVPVLPGYFLNTSAPVTRLTLENQLFDSNPTGTVGAYYSEVSYGQFTVDGDVAGWVELAHDNTYYAGLSSQGGDPNDARVGDLVKELLDANDATMDYGQYDNDGPDGVPNSGDDDGFVDLLCVLHSRRGGECGIVTNIISHTWSYSYWPISGGFPYATNDPAAGGGFIQVDDYTIAPALSCNTPTSEVIEIGVFCHEFGHGLGLPDLYDRDEVFGGNNGIGHWGIMSSGNWNTPDRPAHPEAWTRVELGWVVPTDIGWQPTPVAIPNAEQNAAVFRLPFTNERFRRSLDCAISGNYSLYCGLSEAEGDARNYASPGPGGGYGPNSYETIERDFHYSGMNAVTLQYSFRYDLEANYDYADALIEVNGIETTLATYTGSGAGAANIALTPHLAPLAGAGGTYTIRFRVISDLSFDDADGHDPSSCGALAIDDLSVLGGGEAYVSGFETYADGWHQDPARNPATEYWLAENRRRIGQDVNLHGEGLLIWHVDEETLHAPFLQNDGPGGAVKGLVLEEADGLFNMTGSNFGEASDPFPGTTGNTLFASLTTPASTDNTQRATRIEVSAIGAAAPTMAATLRAGDRGPVATAVTPPVIDNDEVAAQIEVAGLRMAAGATFRFLLSGPGAAAPGGAYDSEDIVPTSIEWIDPTVLRATVNVYSKTGGLWDLIVTNPDGQPDTLASAVTINQIVATRLRAASIVVTAAGVRLRYELFDREPGEVVRLYRSTEADGGWRVIADDLEPLGYEEYEFVDAAVEAGRTYYYLLESQTTDGGPRELHRGSATIPARAVTLEQNHPNPFNPTTSIRFYLPSRSVVALDIYDVRGGLVRRLARGTFDAGPHALAWNGTDEAGRPVASGVYVYRLTADRRSLTRKMTLLK